MRSLKALGAFASAVGALWLSSAAWAGEPSPVGLWKNVDDVSGKPRALIRITESGGVLQGRIEEVFPGPGESPNPKCGKCQGALKDASIRGMVIMSGLKRIGDDYGGGQIVDPDSGKTYSSKIRLMEGGKKLNVRGYLGLPALGRSQTWLRQN